MTELSDIVHFLIDRIKKDGRSKHLPVDVYVSNADLARQVKGIVAASGFDNVTIHVDLEKVLENTEGLPCGRFTGGLMGYIFLNGEP